MLESIQGDLEEQFDEDQIALGIQKARNRFVWNVLRFFRPGIVKPLFKSQKLKTFGMVRNNLKLAYRTAIRQKQFTILNLLGLTLGIATTLAIGLYIHDELNYDTFHAKGDRIYRVNQPNIWGDWTTQSSYTGPNVATALKTDIPEFEEVTRLLSVGPQTISTVNSGNSMNSFIQDDYFAVEPNFFNVFSFNLIAGDPATAFDNPRNMIITLETAQRYFDKDLPASEIIGKKVEVKAWNGEWESFEIKGVAENVPDQSHIQFDVLVSLTSYQEMMDMHGWKWIWTAFSTYGLLQEGVDATALEAKIQSLPAKWAPPTTEKIFNQSFEEFTAGNPWKLVLQPLNEIYISGNPDEHGFGPTGNPLFVKIFGVIGLLVLALSAINFMNLSTARATNRAKEVGVMKVMGSRKSSLLGQFLMESALFTIIATCLAILLLSFSMGWFNELTNKEISLELLAEPLYVGLLIGFVVLVSILSGAYPAFYLSSFAPIHAMKGNLSSGLKGKKFRNALVVFQFTISIGLIICASFVQKQLSYASSLDVGFDRDHVLQIHNIEQFGFDTEHVKAQLQTNPNFTNVGKSFGIPPRIWSGDRYKAEGSEEVVQFNNVRTEEDYLDLLGLTFLEGRNFNPQIATDKYKIIINETATRMLGWGNAETYSEDSPIGKKIAIASGDESKFEVIGVVKDFNFSNIRDKIAPLIILHHQNDSVWDYGGGPSYYSMKLNSNMVSNQGDLLKVIEEVENQMASIDSSVPFEFSFMDQEFDNTFKFEQKMGSVLNVFTLMALIIGCLGLFGLAAFSAEQRMKELSIRKVLGANALRLVYSFTSEFTKLIVISIVIASPLAWYFVDQWLSSFAYRTPINAWVFVTAAAGALIIGVVTIGYQSISVAQKNPAETLKDE